MATEKPESDRRKSTVADYEADAKSKLQDQGSNVSSDLQVNLLQLTELEYTNLSLKSGYSEYDHLSAPQFDQKYGSSQYPEVVSKEHCFPEISPGFSGPETRTYDQVDHPEHSGRRRKKRILVIAAVLLAVLVAGAAGALGGYFGSKRNGNSNDQTPR